MGYWLFKSEPDVFSFSDLEKQGRSGTVWDGVRNYAARNTMRAMQIGEHAFFYHTGSVRSVIGIVQVTAIAHADPSTDDPRWECVDVSAVCSLPRLVSLSEIKLNPVLQNMVLVTHSRLSVQPVREKEWSEICKMAGLLEPPFNLS